MLFDIAQIKSAIRKFLKESIEAKHFAGRLWMPLWQVKEHINVGVDVLIWLSDETRQRLEQDIRKHSQTQRGRDSGICEYMQDLLDDHGTILKLTKYNKSNWDTTLERANFEVALHDIPDMWVSVDNTSVDYRPDESLPEDYYAL